MRTASTRPPVSCQLNLEDGIVDIESFRTGARHARWNETEITIVVIDALYKCSDVDNVGEVLCQYCMDGSLNRATRLGEQGSPA